MYQRAILLHNVRSAHNVGSIFRTADGAGISHIYLSGYTPTPVDRFGREQKEIGKTALGAEKTVAWSYHTSPTSVITECKRRGWTVVGVEQDVRAVDYRVYTVQGDTLFVFGNEVLGMSRALRDRCDDLVEIPMHGSKESLNVSVAAGIILFQFVSVRLSLTEISVWH